MAWIPNLKISTNCPQGRFLKEKERIHFVGKNLLRKVFPGWNMGCLPCSVVVSVHLKTGQLLAVAWRCCSRWKAGPENPWGRFWDSCERSPWMVIAWSLNKVHHVIWWNTQSSGLTFLVLCERAIQPSPEPFPSSCKPGQATGCESYFRDEQEKLQSFKTGPHWEKWVRKA